MRNGNSLYACISPKETLDQMEGMVRESFSAIPNRGIQLPVCPPDPYDTSINRRVLIINPVQSIRVVIMSFIIPDYTKEYQSAVNSNIFLLQFSNNNLSINQ